MPSRTARAAAAGLLALWLALVAVAAPAASLPMQFRHLTSEDGLSQNSVYSVLQDGQGYLWLATADGLDRYDGGRLRHFLPVRGDPHSLPGADTRLLRLGTDGALWVVVKDAGLARFDATTEHFTAYAHDDREPQSLASDAVSDLLVAEDGTLWVAHSDAGLDWLNPATGIAEHFRHDDLRPGSLRSDEVLALARDRRGQLWVATAKGLDRWDPRGRRFVHFQGPGQDGVSRLLGQEPSTLYVDREGSLWVGFRTTNRLVRIDPQTEATRVLALAPEQFALTFHEDAAQRFWVGTSHGLLLVDRTSGQSTAYVRDPADTTSLSDNVIVSLYQDRSGVLWVGTMDGGANAWNPRSWYLGHERPAWLAGTYAIAFAPADRDRLWIGSQGEGLRLFDPASHESQTLDAVYGRHIALPEQRIMALLADSDRGLWIGTLSHGLVHLDGEGRMTTYTASARGALDDGALGHNGIMTLLEARDGTVWVGTFGGGLSIIEPRTHRVRRAGTRDPAFMNARVSALVQDADGVVWAGTVGQGLVALAPTGAALGHWRHGKDEAASLASNTIYALHLDSTGSLWAGTDVGGLDRISGRPGTAASLTFVNYSTNTGLPNNTVFGIEGDRSGALWLSGAKGLVRLDPASGAVRVFHHDQGLQGEEFNFGAHRALPDGRLVFGGGNGFNLFDPLRLLALPESHPALALAEITVKGRPLARTRPLTTLAALSLAHHEDVVSFDFTVLDFASPAKNQYQYRLKGFDRDWVTAPVGQHATYTNLDAGTYQLEARALASDGTPGTGVYALPVVVHAAPWRSTTAYVLYAVSLVFLLLLAHWRSRVQLARAAEAGARLEQVVEARTEELHRSNRELQRLSRAKSEFLARMSHEIRTPMNGILGMTALLLRDNLSPSQTRLAQTVDRSAQNLMRLLNDTLDLAKIEAGKLELDNVPFDLVALLGEAVDTFSAQASLKGLELSFVPPRTLDRLLIGDALRLRQIVLNLIGNAIKFTAKGEVTVLADVQTGAAGATLTLTVRDSGIGMSADVIQRIFDPFSQADESTTRRYGGTGLGLSICRDLTRLMQGRLEVQSEPGAGSTFTVTVTLAQGELLPGTAVPLTCPLLVCAPATPVAEVIGRQGEYLKLETRALDPAALDAFFTRRQPATGVLLVDTDAVAGALAALPAATLHPESVARTLLLGREAAALAARPGWDLALALEKPLRPEALQSALEQLIARGLATAPATVVAAAPAPHLPALSARVLVVEDNEINAAVIEGMLEALGCTHVTVTRGASAVVRVGSERFDAVLLDMHMPGMDGRTAARLMRRTEAGQRGLPLIACTADPADTHRAACLEAGLDDFIAKPMTLEALHAVLSRALAAARSRSDVAPTPVTAVPPTGLADLGAPGLALLYRVGALFLRQGRQQVEAIQQAIGRQDFETVRSQAHSLKSAAAHVGEVRLADLVVRIEGLACEEQGALLADLAPSLATAAEEAYQSIEFQIRKQSA